jgi:hypothetical protein
VARRAAHRRPARRSSAATAPTAPATRAAIEAEHANTATGPRPKHQILRVLSDAELLCRLRRLHERERPIVAHIAALKHRQRRIQRGLDVLAAEARRRGMSYADVANGAVVATGDPAATNDERRRVARRLRVRLFRRNLKLRSTRCSARTPGARSSRAGGPKMRDFDYDQFGRVRRIRDRIVDYEVSDEELADADLGDPEDDVDDDDELDDHDEGP